MKEKAFFFDRDGTVNFRVVGEYIQNPEELSIIHDFYEFFSYVKQKGYLCIIITNQQGIGKGLMTSDDLVRIHQKMQKELKAKTGFEFDDIYFCPELADSGCHCRKPKPGMILDAMKKWDIDPKASWMVGDSVKDCIAGRAAEVETVLIGNELSNDDSIDHSFINFSDFFEYIKTRV